MRRTLVLVEDRLLIVELCPVYRLPAMAAVDVGKRALVRARAAWIGARMPWSLSSGVLSRSPAPLFNGRVDSSVLFQIVLPFGCILAVRLCTLKRLLGGMEDHVRLQFGMAGEFFAAVRHRTLVGAPAVFRLAS